MACVELRSWVTKLSLVTTLDGPKLLVTFSIATLFFFLIDQIMAPLCCAGELPRDPVG